MPNTATYRYHIGQRLFSTILPEPSDDSGYDHCEYCGHHGEISHLRAAWRQGIRDKYQAELGLLVYSCHACLLRLISGESMPRKYWTDANGKQIEMKAMDLGHLSNSIRMMGERLEEYRSAGETIMVDRAESILMDLQDELANRDKEIEQAQGIMRGLLKGIRP